MNITYINYEDLIGRRFNGYDLCNYYNSKGSNNCNMFVCEKSDETSFVHQVWPSPIFSKIHNLSNKLERYFSVQNMLYIPALLYRSQIRRAEIVHLNLISCNYLNFLELALLSNFTPMVLQLHEFSLLTGHCSHPELNCFRWHTGCGDCPNLGGEFPLRKDTTKFLWHYKKWIWAHSKLDIVVSTKWLLDKIKDSPMLSHCRKHVIPFGLNLSIFCPGDKEGVRKKMNIPSDSFVIMFRALNTPHKGLDTIKQALSKLKIDKPVYLITLNGKGLLDELKGRYKMIEIEWESREEVIADLFRASDLFLMPSVRETFGMMAIEAMACGVPSIVSQDTPLVEVTRAPEAGIAIPAQDPEALCQAINELYINDEKRRALGQRGRELAIELYDFRHYADQMEELYQEIIDVRKA